MAPSFVALVSMCVYSREHVRVQANSIKRSESRLDTTKLLYPKGGGVSSPDRTGSRVPSGYTNAAIPERGRRILTGPDRVTSPAGIQ